MATARNKRRTKKAGRSNGTAMPDVDIAMTSDGPMPPFGTNGLGQGFDPAAGTIEIPNDDGTVIIQLGEPEAERKDSKFDDNLAEDLDDIVLGRISEKLLEAIEQDDSDRSEWLQERADGLPLLGLKVEKPGTGNVGSSATAVAGQSTVRDAVLAEACDRFQANAFAELCPSEGPCKVMSYGDETPDDDKLAEDLEKDINFYLTGSGPGTAKEYYPDMRRMLWWTGYASGTFKKVYRCPLRERPVSESVDGEELIVPSNATDLASALRITHRIDMNHVTMKQMQLQGAYRDVELTAPTPQPGPVTQKEGTITGMNPNLTRPEDQNYTIYECYCSLDIEGYEHKRGGKPTGLPVPYRVVIDKDSRTVLEIRRNWKPPQDGEEDALPVAKIPFVFFPYATGMGFYGTGLLHRLGNYALALTAMLRICIDSGMFANFPGFLFAKPAGRQLQNEFRVPPGGGAPIDVSAVGNNINNAVMALPYKPVDAGFVGVMAQTRENASRYGGTAEAPTGEGVVNAPVGSVLAAIDQATRIEGGVHKALYAAQREELGLIVELFRDDPEALWRGNKRPAMGKDIAARTARFKQALEKYDLVPASDPNVPSHMHRLAKANAYLQTAMALPGVFILQNVIKRWAAMVKIDGVENDLAPQAAPQPDPVAMAKLQIDKQNADTKAAEAQAKIQLAHAQLQSREQIEATKIAAQHAAGQPGTGHKISETLTYKDAPPDIQRQIEMQAGLQPSQMQPQAAEPPPPPDPNQARALDIKDRQVSQAGTKMLLDAHGKHADRQSKENIEAMKIGQALAVHPDSQPVVNSELEGLSPYLKPTPEVGAPTGGMSGGGPVDHATPEPSPELESVQLALRIAAIARALQQSPQSEYTH